MAFLPGTEDMEVLQRPGEFKMLQMEAGCILRVEGCIPRVEGCIPRVEGCIPRVEACIPGVEDCIPHMVAAE